MGSPVRGLRPTRAGRSLASKLPKPTSCTLSPPFMAVSTVPVKAARATSQSFFVRPLTSDMAAVNITREQLVTMLYRYAGFPATNGSLDNFSDASTVSSYAVNAMQWAVANGIVNGSNGKLNPKNNAIRAEVAAILMRFREMSK